MGEARSRRAQKMRPRERVVLTVSAALFLVAALIIALVVPNERTVEPLVVIGLAIGYGLAERVRFEFGGTYGTAEQLLLVPPALLAPLPLVPIIIALANVVAILPEMFEGTWHRDRLTGRLADCWFCIPPVLVLAALAPGQASPRPRLGLRARVRRPARRRLRTGAGATRCSTGCRSSELARSGPAPPGSTRPSPLALW